LTYNTAVESFNTFRKQYAFRAEWPARHNQIVLYIAFCFEKGLAARTIATYVAGIAFVHKINDGYDIGESFVVKKLLEGCKRQHRTRDSRAPVTLTMLSKIWEVLPLVCFSRYEITLFKAAFSVAFSGWRISRDTIRRRPSNSIR